MNIDTVWARIRKLEGHDFETKRGLPFRYEISGDIFLPSRTKYKIAKTNFEKALEHTPMDGLGQISNLVRGSAYVWAVLHDARIRRSDW